MWEAFACQEARQWPHRCARLRGTVEGDRNLITLAGYLLFEGDSWSFARSSEIATNVVQLSACGRRALGYSRARIHQERRTRGLRQETHLRITRSVVFSGARYTSSPADLPLQSWRALGCRIESRGGV